QDLHSFPTRRSSDLWDIRLELEIHAARLDITLVGTTWRQIGFCVHADQAPVATARRHATGRAIKRIHTVSPSRRRDVSAACAKRSEEHTSELQSREN